LRAGWRGSGDGASLAQEALWRGPRGGLLYWGTWKMRSLRDIQNALWVGLPLYTDPFGEPRGVHLLGLSREMNNISEYLFEPGGHSGFKSEWGISLTQTYISGFLLFGPRR
jgi:hypothetical protein